MLLIWFDTIFHDNISGDEIRRLVTESFLPYLTEKGHELKKKREYAKSKKETEEKAHYYSQVC